MRIASILLLIAAAAVVAQDEKKPSAEDRLAALKWLSGSWSGEMWGGVFTAYYSTPDGGKILSYSHLKKDWPTRIEFVRTGDKLVITLTDPFDKSSAAKKEVFNLSREK